MLEEKAQVIDIEERTLWLQTEVKTTCGSCAAKENCGTSAVAKAFSAKPNVIGVQYDPSEFVVNKGDMVTIGVEERFVVKSAMYVYIMPIVGFMLLAFIAQLLLEQNIVVLSGIAAELFSAVVAFVGGFGGYFVARKRLAGFNSADNACVSGSHIRLLAVTSQQIPIKVKEL